VKGDPPEPVLQAWRQGIILSGRKTMPAQVRVLDRTRDQTMLEVIISEGRNRQIRRTASQLGYPVVRLHRTAIGSIQLQPPSVANITSGAATDPLQILKLFFMESSQPNINQCAAQRQGAQRMTKNLFFYSSKPLRKSCTPKRQNAPKS
jgi:ribosomal large subunit pseudouridine synthase B (EC 5.4.99.-)